MEGKWEKEDFEYQPPIPIDLVKSNLNRLCIDYGGKRTGIAVTDPFKIIATGLETVDTKEVFSFLKKYFLLEQVELVLIGEPKNLDDTDTHATVPVKKFTERMKREFPAIPIEMVDERYSSKNASRAMIEMGMKKKNRQDKKNVDIIAATMMLQEYMQRMG